MKLLITGATGLIGQEIVELCNKQGISVNYLTTNKNKIISNDNFKGFNWNPDINEIDLRCFEGVSAIINLAGSSISKRWSPENKKDILFSRINALKTLNQALGKIDSKSIKSFVSASAIGIYPNSFCHFYTEEEQEVDDSFLGEVVHTWEKEIDTMNHFGFKVSKIRIGLVLAKDGGALPQLVKPIKNYVGAAFGNGKQWQSWIHVSDLAKMFLFIAQNNLEGIFNGVSPNPITNAKMVKEIAELFQVPLILPKIPKSIMKIILGEMSYLLFASQRVSSKKIAEEGFIFEFPNIGNALQNICHPRLSKNLEDQIPTEEFLS